MGIFYILFPFFGFFVGIKNFFKKSSNIALLSFAFWFGYSVFFYGGDIVRYEQSYQSIVEFSYSDYFDNILNSLNEDKKFINGNINSFNLKPDIYALSVSFLVSRLTDNPRWLFAVVSLIYFYFFLQFLKEAVKFTGYRSSRAWKLFFLMLALIVPFYVGVTGIRFWTALFLYAWMVMKFINTGKFKFLLYSALSIAFHYTFIFPVFMTFFIYYFKIKKSVFKVLLVLGVIYAVVVSSSNVLDFISNALQFIDNETVEQSASSYLDQDRLNERLALRESVNWYVTWRVNLINIFFGAFFLLDFFGRIKKINQKENLFFTNLYQLFFLVSLFTFNLGSIGRFVYIFYLLVLIRIISFQTLDVNRKLRFYNLIFLPIFLIHVLVTFRSGFYYVDPLLLVSPSFILLFFQSEISLSQLLIGH